MAKKLTVSQIPRELRERHYEKGLTAKDWCWELSYRFLITGMLFLWLDRGEEKFKKKGLELLLSPPVYRPGCIRMSPPPGPVSILREPVPPPSSPLSVAFSHKFFARGTQPEIFIATVPFDPRVLRQDETVARPAGACSSPTEAAGEEKKDLRRAWVAIDTRYHQADILDAVKEQLDHLCVGKQREARRLIKRSVLDDWDYYRIRPLWDLEMWLAFHKANVTDTVRALVVWPFAAEEVQPARVLRTTTRRKFASVFTLEAIETLYWQGRVDDDLQNI